MLGDMKFHQHETIDAGAAELWRQQYRTDLVRVGRFTEVAWPPMATIVHIC